MSDISLNDTVMVKLTEYGKGVLDQYWGKAEEKYDAEGRYTAQLWHIINVFGSHIGLGKEDVFLDNKIYILEDLEDG